MCVRRGGVYNYIYLLSPIYRETKKVFQYGEIPPSPSAAPGYNFKPKYLEEQVVHLIYFQPGLNSSIYCKQTRLYSYFREM